MAQSLLTKRLMDASAVRSKLSVAWKLINETLDEFSKDRGDLLAAALAFYTLLSIAPLIIIAVAVAGFVLGEGSARAEVTRLLMESMGPVAAETINGWVDQASRAGAVASVIGFVLVVFTASRLFAQLKSALNQIWNVDVFIAESFKANIKDQLRRRLFAFAMVLAAGPLLLTLVASRAVLSGLHEVLFADSAVAGILVQITQFLFSIVLVAIMSVAVFRLLPDTRIGFRAVWAGGLLTSILFNIGNVLVGLYLGRAGVSETYGAAASVIVVLLWLHYSAQMFLLGAEFTQVYATHYGRGLNTEEQREYDRAIEQGKRAAEKKLAPDRDKTRPSNTDRLREA